MSTPIRQSSLLIRLPLGRSPLHAGNLDSQPAEDAAQSVADNSAAPVRVSSGTVAGMAISKPDPIYPAIAKAAHIQGAVILHAIISKQGTIEQLSIVSVADAGQRRPGRRSTLAI